MHNHGTIFNIQRFSTSDGPGIRTVVFLKGCPLHCAWCHNPESQSTSAEILYKKELCMNCGACAALCTKTAHTFTDGRHLFNRQACITCGCCADACDLQALERCGETKTTEEILELVLRDKPFYEESGGGITLSGGEPLLQYDFILSLLQSAKEHGLHTAIETSGFSGKDLRPLNDYTDLWLYDIKLFPEEEHLKYTGVSNKLIFDNLFALDRLGAHIILRCPIIPGISLTEKHFEELGKLAGRLHNLSAIHLEPYHPLGLSKAQQLDRIQPYQNDKFLEASAVIPFADMLRANITAEVLIL